MPRHDVEHGLVGEEERDQRVAEQDAAEERTSSGCRAARRRRRGRTGAGNARGRSARPRRRRSRCRRRSPRRRGTRSTSCSRQVRRERARRVVPEERRAAGRSPWTAARARTRRRRTRRRASTARPSGRSCARGRRASRASSRTARTSRPAPPPRSSRAAAGSRASTPRGRARTRRTPSRGRPTRSSRKRTVASANFTPTFSSTNVQSVRLGRDTGVASMALSSPRGKPARGQEPRARSRAPPPPKGARPGASSFRTDWKPISSPSGEIVTYSSSLTAGAEPAHPPLPDLGLAPVDLPRALEAQLALEIDLRRLVDGELPREPRARMSRPRSASSFSATRPRSRPIDLELDRRLGKRAAEEHARDGGARRDHEQADGDEAVVPAVEPLHRVAPAIPPARSRR